MSECSHVMANGGTCSSPALRGEDFCYFHRASRDRVRRQRIAAERKLPLQVPILEDHDTIQLAITDVVNALLADRIDHKKASLVLYALQTAAINAKHTHFGYARNSYQEYSPELDPGLPELQEETELPEKKSAASVSAEEVIEEIQASVEAGTCVPHPRRALSAPGVGTFSNVLGNHLEVEPTSPASASAPQRRSSRASHPSGFARRL